MLMFKVTECRNRRHYGRFATQYEYKSLPGADGSPSEWYTQGGKLHMCWNGFHGCTQKQVPLWFSAWGNKRYCLWLIDVRGRVYGRSGDTKTLFRKFRFVKQIKTQKEFNILCDIIKMAQGKKRG